MDAQVPRPTKDGPGQARHRLRELDLGLCGGRACRGWLGAGRDRCGGLGLGAWCDRGRRGGLGAYLGFSSRLAWCRPWTLRYVGLASGAAGPVGFDAGALTKSPREAVLVAAWALALVGDGWMTAMNVAESSDHSRNSSLISSKESGWCLGSRRNTRRGVVPQG